MKIDLTQYKKEDLDPPHLDHALRILQKELDKEQHRLDITILNEPEFKKLYSKNGGPKDPICAREHEVRNLSIAIEILKVVNKPLQLV